MKGLNEIKSAIEGVIELLSDSHKEEKKAYNLFSIGDQVVAVDQIEGLTQGEKYKVSDNNSKPGYITVEDLKGEQVGMYRGDRFVKDNEEY